MRLGPVKGIDEKVLLRGQGGDVRLWGPVRVAQGARGPVGSPYIRSGAEKGVGVSGAEAGDDRARGGFGSEPWDGVGRPPGSDNDLAILFGGEPMCVQSESESASLGECEGGVRG